MDLREAAAFLAVHDHGGFTAAAHHLNVVPSTVSETISSLERRAGTKLFERTSRRVTTTDAGLKLVVPARRLLAAHAEVLLALENDTDARLHIGVLYGAGLREATAVESGRSDLDVVVCEMEDLSVGLNSAEPTTASIIAGPTPIDDRLQRIKLWEEPRIAVFSADHPLAERDSVTVAEVDAVGWPRVASSDPNWTRFWRLDGVRGGPAPESGPLLDSGTAVFQRLLSGRSSIVTLESYGHVWAVDGLAFVPVSGVASVDVELCFLAQQPRALLAELADQLIDAHRDLRAR